MTDNKVNFKRKMNLVSFSFSLIKKTIFIIMFLGMLFLGSCSTVFLMQSKHSIRNKLLQNTPPGTSITEVNSYFKNNNFKKIIYYDNGFYDHDISSSSIGEKYYRVLLGEYRILFITSVTAFWVFNEENKLIDIYVWKTTDAL